MSTFDKPVNSVCSLCLLLTLTLFLIDISPKAMKRKKNKLNIRNCGVDARHNKQFRKTSFGKSKRQHGEMESKLNHHHIEIPSFSQREAAIVK